MDKGRIGKLVQAASTFTVNAAPTSMFLPPTGSTSWGQSVQFTATVTSSNQVPAGTVLILVVGNPLGSTVNFTGGTATSAAIVTLSATTHSCSRSFTPFSSNFRTSSVRMSHVVNKAHLTVTTSIQAKTYDGGPLTLFGADYTGSVNGENSSVISGSAEFKDFGVDAVKCGTYSFTPLLGTLSTDNYDFPTRLNGAVTINKAHLAVTADAKSKTNDGSPFIPFTATITGFVNGEDAASAGLGGSSG